MACSSEELLLQTHGAQVCFVDASGHESQLWGPGVLQLVQLIPGPALQLQVCDFRFVLTPDSPTWLCNGMYMWDEWNGTQTVRVLLSFVDAQDRDMFHHMFARRTSFRDQDGGASYANSYQPELSAPPRHEDSEEFVRGGLSATLKKGSKFVCKNIQKGGTKIREHTKPHARPTHVNPVSMATLERVAKATDGAAEATEYLVDAAHGIADFAGNKVGSQIDDQDIRKGARVVHGVHEFFSTLREASEDFFQCVEDETVRTVEHRNGPEAGRAASHGAKIFRNIFKSAKNVVKLGPGHMMTKFITSGCKAILEKPKKKQ